MLPSLILCDAVRSCQLYKAACLQMMIRVQSPDGQKRVELDRGDTSDVLLAKVNKI